MELIDTLGQDLRHAARRLRQTPGFTLVAALTLALGIGGNAAVLSALEALLLRPLPYPDPEQLVLVHQTDPRQPRRAVAPANFLDWRERARSFEGLAAYEVVGRTLGAGESARRLDTGIVSGSFFDVLGTRAALGRGFAPATQGPREVVLGHVLWQERFGGEPAIVGRELQLDQELVRVVGVMPRGFAFPREAALWLRAKDDLPELPIAANVDLRTLRDARYLGVVGRLRAGTTLATAAAEMDHVAAALAAEYPDANEGNGARVEPLFEALRGGARPALRLLLCAACCVLLIACANVANLLLARSVGRRQELAVRAALGASRTRLARQLVSEALLVAALGGGAGLALAWASRPLMTALWPASLPPLEELRLSGPVLLFSGLVSVACVVLVSLVPVRLAARVDALAGLRASGRTPLGGPGAQRMRGLIVVAEVALAVVLVNGAGLLLGTLWRLQQAPLGFETAGTLTARLDFPRALSRDAAALRTFASNLEERLRSLPGVTAAAVGQALPLSGLRTSAGLRVEGRELEPNAQLDTCWRLVSPGWHAALGVALRRGRGFEASDSRTAPAVALVNATLARQVFGDADPVGRRIATGLDGPPGSWVTIIGIVADTPQENVAKATRPEMYRPLAQDVRMGPSGLALVVRAAGDPISLGPAVRREVAALRRDVAVSQVLPLDGLARDMVAAPRAASRVLLLFAGLALFLAALGLYGVVSCLVSESTRELGVRLALGAQPASLVSLVLRRSLALGGLGLAVGIGAALAVGRLLEGILFGVSPRDPVTLAGVTLVLLLATAAAGYGPARRAGRLDPARVLRAD
jgi:putative ABC transport system permease protein